jgi:vacuolar protein sorting-associated protein 45
MNGFYLSSFLALVRDAAGRFPPSISSSTLATRPYTTQQQQTSANQGEGGGGAAGGQGGLNLQLGNLSLSVGTTNGQPSRTANTIEAGVDGVRDVARNLFGRVRKGVEGLQQP